jgi:hypothetical protein
MKLKVCAWAFSIWGLGSPFCGMVDAGNREQGRALWGGRVAVARSANLRKKIRGAYGTRMAIGISKTCEVLLNHNAFRRYRIPT